jgi:tryptophan halogenase
VPTGRGFDQQPGRLAGRFIRPRPEGGIAAGRIAYAYHFDASPLRRYLRELSEARGVQRIEGKVVASNQRATTAYRR